MNKDYLYCINQNTCIHRRGCKRWIGNYTDEEAIEEADRNIHGYVNEKHCVPDYQDENCENSFDFLDRFRSSTGE
jgi:hypothetical protein